MILQALLAQLPLVAMAQIPLRQVSGVSVWSQSAEVSHAPQTWE
jgi:hypothetical protein